MKRDRRGMIFGLACLAMGIWFLATTARTNADAEEVPADVKAAVDKMADLIAKGKTDDAKKVAAEIAKKAGISADKPGSMEGIMHVFAPRGKKGYGVGDKPGMVKPDGMELKIQAMGDPMKKELTKKQWDAEKDAIKKMAEVTQSIADVTALAKPAKDEGKKKVKDWEKWTEEMQKGAADLAKAKDPKEAKNAAKLLDGSCTSCHEVFRKR